MLKKAPLWLRFILAFFVSGGILLLFWETIKIAYLGLLVFFGNPLWTFTGYPVQMIMTDNTLHFQYSKLGDTPLSFTVHEVHEIYLNLVLLLALFFAAVINRIEKINLSFPASLFTLFAIHLLILFGYAYTNIWSYIESQDPMVQDMMLLRISDHFPKIGASIFNAILLHWNAWGWDVLPLALWLFSIRKFIMDKIS